MSSNNAPTIAITGINGFIATEVALIFISNGWHVRGSVRTHAQVETLKAHPAYAKYFASGVLRAVVVEDLTKSDLSELFDGVQAVASLAAPLPSRDPSVTWKDFKIQSIEPALRILKHAQKANTIKSVIITSSNASALDIIGGAPGKVYTEDDWNPLTEEYCQSLDLATNPMTPAIWYFAAKKLTEQAVLEFQDTEKPPFSITILCPSMVCGPANYIDTTQAFKDRRGVPSNQILNIFVGKDQPLPMKLACAFVDVRDVAAAFYAAATKQVSGRFMLSGHEFDWQEFVDKLRALRPDLDAYFPLGEPGKDVPGDWAVDASKSKKEFGLQYRSTEDTLKDTVNYLESIGLFKEAPAGLKTA
ncbi:hypothetical protein I350_07012 [Cryptococcus amylolentus CBS 6273]|uniref:NAD-dependent epimerase/dehydratase domain-containing protein n=1 Tax=Cryptococcus amylolentus CBS 6273 TaxID=1296118 RepID=A0A1E3JI97_9TREE|nr:hypothetical protein I350_07012 [Cryptococcus amylolentus CBS 6273]